MLYQYYCSGCGFDEKEGPKTVIENDKGMKEPHPETLFCPICDSEQKVVPYVSGGSGFILIGYDWSSKFKDGARGYTGKFKNMLRKPGTPVEGSGSVHSGKWEELIPQKKESLRNKGVHSSKDFEGAPMKLRSLKVRTGD